MSGCVATSGEREGRGSRGGRGVLCAASLAGGWGGAPWGPWGGMQAVGLDSVLLLDEAVVVVESWGRVVGWVGVAAEGAGDLVFFSGRLSLRLLLQSLVFSLPRVLSTPPPSFIACATPPPPPTTTTSPMDECCRFTLLIVAGSLPPPVPTSPRRSRRRLQHDGVRAVSVLGSTLVHLQQHEVRERSVVL